MKPSAKGINTEQIGRILVDRKLSKKSILESPNKLKRARDHALNASMLGFFIPIPQDHQFLYARSPIADELSRYTFDQGCPSDLHESAVFVDRMMKLKLTNAYDSRRTYSRFHTRPFLSILKVLRDLKLHISEIHYLLSQTRDLAVSSTTTRKLLHIFAEYPPYDEKSIPRFMKDFKLEDKKTLKEIGRSTKPLVDWMRQGGLLTLDKDNWATITENGFEVQKYYSELFPIWYDWLPSDGVLSAAILIAYNHAMAKGLRIERKRLNKDAIETLHELQAKFALWNASFSRLSRRVDFDVNYDVPFELRGDVTTQVNQLAKDLGLDKVNLNEASKLTISEIEQMLTKTSVEQRQIELNIALGIDIPRPECFQTEFEWRVCVRLRVLQLPAHPYQGEYEGVVDLPMATDNPDIVVRDELRTLVECKSRNEWGNIVKYDKRVGGELHMYQSYVEGAQANSVIFVCDVDAFDHDAFVTPFLKQSDKLSKILLVCWSYLDRVQKDKKLLERFNTILKNPEVVPPTERILC